MNHSEAINEMAAERYLLGELSSESRDAFEEHLFDCPECALDVRSGSALVAEAKTQLPEMIAGSAASRKTVISPERNLRWFAWLRPAFAVPALAMLLAVVGYQNLVTLPALHKSANEPRIVQVAPLYGATRGDTHISITAGRASGIALPIDLPLDSAGQSYASFSFELRNPQDKPVWTTSTPAPAQNAGGDAQISIVVPGEMLESGTYTLTVSGVGTDGSRATVGRYVFDIALSD